MPRGGQTFDAMLKKRETRAEVASQKRGLSREEFLKTYARGIENLEERVVFFVDLEFPGKQRHLISYWERLLGLYFKHASLCSFEWLETLKEFFTVGQQKPECLGEVSRRLCGVKDFASLLSGVDFAGVESRLFAEPPSQLRRLLLACFSNKKTQPIVLLHVESFRNNHTKFTIALNDFLAGKSYVGQDELFRELSEATRLPEEELGFQLGLACHQNRLAKEKKKWFVFYCRPKDFKLAREEVERELRDKSETFERWSQQDSFGDS